MEILSPLNQVVHTTNAARLAVFKPPDPARVTPGEGTARAQADADRTSRNDANSALMRGTRSNDRPAADTLQDVSNRPAGPPPAFEISLLEQALDLKRTMARLEARRRQAEDARAVRPDMAAAQDRQAELSLLSEADARELSDDTAITPADSAAESAPQEAMKSAAEQTGEQTTGQNTGQTTGADPG